MDLDTLTIAERLLLTALEQALLRRDMSVYAIHICAHASDEMKFLKLLFPDNVPISIAGEIERHQQIARYSLMEISHLQAKLKAMDQMNSPDGKGKVM